MTRNKLLIVILVLVVGAALGVRSMRTASEPAREPRRIVLQLQWQPGAQFIGFYAAKDRGFFEAEGLDVEFRHGGPGIDPVEAVAQGLADIGLASGDQAFMWAADHRGTHEAITVFGTVFAKSLARFMSDEERAVREPADFRGRRVGVFPGQDTDHLLRILIARNAIPADEVEVVPFPDLEQFERGEIDVYPSYTINEPVLERQRNRRVYELDPEEFGVRFYSDTMFARAEFHRDEQDVIERFLRAAARGWMLTESDTQAAVEAMGRQVGAAIGAGAAWEHHVRGAHEAVKYLRAADGPDGLFVVDQARWHDMAAALAEVHEVATAVDPDALCDFDLAPRVLRTLSGSGPS